MTRNKKDSVVEKQLNALAENKQEKEDIKKELDKATAQKQANIAKLVDHLEKKIWPTLPAIEEFIKLDAAIITITDNEFVPIDKKTREITQDSKNVRDYIESHPDMKNFEALISKIVTDQKNAVSTYFIDKLLETEKSIELEGTAIEREEAIFTLSNYSAKLDFVVMSNPLDCFKRLIASEYDSSCIE